MQEFHTSPAVGMVVTARGERWQVCHARRAAQTALVTLEGLEPANARRVTTLILPFDRVSIVRERPPLRRRRQVVARLLLGALSGPRPDGGLWTAADARIDLLAWQLEPALLVLGGATRVLIADAVGLGKTIQAGLVLAELRARGLVERALVLAPASVRGWWVDEWRQRFGLPAVELDPAGLLTLERGGPAGANPWSRAPIVVSSIDLVKRPEVRAAVERVPLDLLVVDEAHHATPGTDRHDVVSRLAVQVPWIVLASATPHSGDAAAYRSLLGIGELDARAGDRMHVFRRSHAAVAFHLPRRTHLLRVAPSAAEARLQSAVLDYARELCRASGDHPGVHLLAAVLARRACSTPRAIRLTLERRLAVLGREETPQAPEPMLPWTESEDEGDGATQGWLAAPGLTDVGAERSRLRALIDLAAAAVIGASKLSRLRRLVDCIGEAVIVFTEFRDSLEACLTAFGAGDTLVALHGGLDPGERRRRLGAFLDGEARILVATDVAGEGLNLQSRSRVVITLEWPWNPLRLEQRIGRVHRLGQSRTVHAFHLTASGSYEETVVSRVLLRASQALQDLDGNSSQVADDVASGVLDLPAAAPATLGARLERIEPATAALARTEAARLASLRAVASNGRRGWMPSVWAVPRRASGLDVVVAVEVTRQNSSGGLRSSGVVSLKVTLRERPRDRRAWRLLCHRLAADPRIRRVALDATATPARLPNDAWSAVRARVAELRRRHRQRHRTRTLQPSLFARRSSEESPGPGSVETAWDDWWQRLEDRLAPSAAIDARTRIVAILPLGPAAT